MTFRVACVLVVALASACGKGAAVDRPEAAAEPTAVAEATPATPAGAIEPSGPGGPVAPGGDYFVEHVDALRTIIDHDVLLQVVLDVSSGALRTEAADGGVKLVDVAAGSLVAELGFQSGDVVLSVNHGAITDAASARKAYEAVRGSGDVRVRFRRRGAEKTHRFVLESSLEDALGTRPARRRTSPRLSSRVPSFEGDLLAALKTGIRVAGSDTFEIDHEVLKVIAENQALLERPSVTGSYGLTRGVTVGVGDNVYGVLGVTGYDVVKAINDVDIESGQDLEREVRAQKDADTFTISIVRLREPLIFRYKVVTSVVDQAQLTKALKEWQEVQAERASPRDRLGADSSGAKPDYRKVVEKVNETKYRVNRKAFHEVLENPTQLARGARIVPSIKNGRANGFKLYAIRPSSIYAALGLMNGDTINAVNGMDLSTPDKALEIYTKVRDAKRVTLELTRRGKPVTLHYVMK